MTRSKTKAKRVYTCNPAVTSVIAIWTKPVAADAIECSGGSCGVQLEVRVRFWASQAAVR